MLACFALAGTARGQGLAAPQPVAAPARAQPTASGPAKPEPEAAAPRLELEAESLTIDPNTQELWLEGAASLAGGRYRLFGQRLGIRRLPGSLEVVGPAALTLCPCRTAPVRIGFERLQLDSEGALELTQPSLRLGAVPVLWAPWLRLQGPHQVGLLPLQLAWRGEDGLLLGGGVHAPLGGSAGYVQTMLGVYSRGGVALGLGVETPSSASSLRWEELDGHGLWLDLRGSWDADPNWGGAWTVDAIRGSRGLAGTLPLADAARSSDRARAVLGGGAGGGTYALSLRSDAARGGPLGRIDLVGPEVGGSFGTALTASSFAQSELRLLHWRAPERDVSLVQQRAELGAAGHVGSLALSAAVGERFSAEPSTSRAWLSGELASYFHVGLPLVKEFGGSLALRHWLEPFVETSLLGFANAGTADVGALLPLGDDGSWATAAGLSTRLGRLGGASALGGDARVGLVRHAGGWQRALRSQAVIQAPMLRLSARGAASTPGRRWTSTTKLELGPVSGPELAGYVEGRSTPEPIASALLERGAWELWPGPWFAISGWSGGGELRVPFGAWALGGALDADLTHQRWLASRATALYRHRCRCLRVEANVLHRLGRGGLDVLLQVDLTPQ